MIVSAMGAMPMPAMAMAAIVAAMDTPALPDLDNP
jgi:hypothetical protein